MPSSSLDLVTSTNKPETHDDNRYEIVIFYTCKLQFRLEKNYFGFTIYSNLIQNPINNMLLFYSNEPTPGGPLTNERIKELGIIKMNDYLATGTRQQFWEEYYVKVVMQVRYFFLIFKLYDIFEFFNESIIFVYYIGIHKKSILLFPIF